MRTTHAYFSYVFTNAVGMGATTAAYAPFLEHIGLTLADISLLNMFFWILMLSSEVPTGMIADGKSRTWSIKIGLALNAIGALAYVFAQGFRTALIAEAIVGIGMACISGADKAWITDALMREGREQDRRSVYMGEMIVRGIGMVAGGVLGAWIATMNLAWTWIPMVASGPIGILIVHFGMKDRGEPMHRMGEHEALQASLNVVREKASLKWALFAMASFGAVLTVNHFWSLYFNNTAGVEWNGWIWAGLYLSIVFANVVTRRIGTKEGNEAAWILVAMGLMAGGMVLAGWLNEWPWVFGALVIHEIGRGVMTPNLDTFIQYRIESGYRATFGSLQSLLGRLGNVLTLFLAWLWLDGKPSSVETIQAIWVLSGFGIIMMIIVLIIFKKRTSHEVVMQPT